ncbi:IS3 family transposase, partial [Escherichia coli]|uniref:IS3 family transposase n=1 Tax=Escherichia coli TaxID=562 RepID=UPI001E63FB41
SFRRQRKKCIRDSYRFNNRDEAISVIREYIEIFYNRQRRHSRLGNISPAAFREKYHQMAA